MAALQICLILICCAFSSTIQRSEGDFNIVCYYPTEDPGDVTKLQPEYIDPSLCTHIIVGFATVANNTLKPQKPEDLKAYEKVLALKSKSPNIKILLAAGGGGSTAEFSLMVKSKQSRANFIESSVKFLKSLGFDGFDMDWEFPGWQEDPPEDLQLFSNFLQEFRQYVGPEFLLSVDVAAVQPIVSISYDVPKMAESVSFINIMCYGYHGYQWYFPFTAHNSPLYKRTIESAYFATLNTAWSVDYWLGNGMPASKIHMGIPTYGSTLKLLRADWNGLDAPVLGMGLFDGTIVYPLVCLFLKSGGVETFDEESQVPYAYHGTDWISYETQQSIHSKVAFATKKELAGVMTFDLNCDDWAGTCDHMTKFPLHRAIRSAFVKHQNT